MSSRIMGAPAPGFVRRGLKVPHLRLFAALAETGQISAAAETLAISQPAASRLAAETERIVGAELYQRTSRGIELSPAGEAFARRARRMLLEIEETEREVREILEGRSGRVNVGSITGPAVEYVLPSIRQARHAEPRVTVNVEVATSDVLCEQLAQGDLDFYLGRLPDDRDKRQFDLHNIGPEPISLIVRSGHPLLRSPERALERLPEFDWVLPFERTLLRVMIENTLIRRGIPLPGKVINTSSLMLTVVTVSRTNAIAPLSTSVARFFTSEFGNTGSVVELPVELALEVEPYALIRSAGRELTPAAQAMYEVVLTEVSRSRTELAHE
jgi:DNA-binding transcriptional LysR family regulator